MAANLKCEKELARPSETCGEWEEEVVVAGENLQGEEVSPDEDKMEGKEERVEEVEEEESRVDMRVLATSFEILFTFAMFTAPVSELTMGKDRFCEESACRIC